MLQVPLPVELPDVVVTGARLPPAAGEAAFSLVRLTAADLRTAQRLDEALTAVPAVSLFRRTSSLSANPTTQGISLRAIAPSGAGRTLVTLDGVPLNDPFGGWVIWSQVPTESLSGLDIIRGAGAGPYGAGALTGVIRLRERDDGNGIDGSLADRGGARLGASGATSLGLLRLVLSGLYEHTDGYVPVRGPAAGTADTPLDLEVRSAAVRVDLPMASAILSLRAGAFEEDRGSGLAGARATAGGNSLSATAAAQPTGTRPGWRLQVWRRESDLANTSVAVAADRNSTTPANDQFATPATGWGLNAAARAVQPLFGGRLEGEVGADARVNEGETRERFRFIGGAFTRSRIAGGETTVAGAYLDGAWAGGPWLVAGGLRQDHWQNREGRRLERDLATGASTLDETDPDRSGEVFSARFGVRRRLSNGQSLRAAGYSSFRPATLNELHRPFRVGNDLTEANAALVPERLSGLEAGWGWAGDRASVAATAFWTRVEDAIVNVTVGAGPGVFPRAGFVPAGGVLRQRLNGGTIKARGIELDGRLELDDSLRVRAALSATDARLDGGQSAPQLTGLRPAQAPIWSATAGLDWQAGDRLRLAGDLRWEGRRFDDDLNSRVLEAATTINLRAEWSVNRRTTLWIAADNLFDTGVEVSETATGVTGLGAPRSVTIGLRLTGASEARP